MNIGRTENFQVDIAKGQICLQVYEKTGIRITPRETEQLELLLRQAREAEIKLPEPTKPPEPNESED